jgi:hypothetical protein
MPNTIRLSSPINLIGDGCRQLGNLPIHFSYRVVEFDAEMLCLNTVSLSTGGRVREQRRLSG